MCQHWILKGGNIFTIVLCGGITKQYFSRGGQRKHLLNANGTLGTEAPEWSS